MNKPIVSFCIATFQRYEILKELVQEILSVKTDKIEVVISDDKSLDESVKKIKKIEDIRLKIYVNAKNVGSSLNIHDSLDKGNGKYLFYVNDRDNVDQFKIEKLIEILEELDKEDVAFAKCYSTYRNAEKYHIFNSGKESLIQFACRIDHPTGYIFKKNVWRKINKKRKLFENQDYGDYPITQICAIMAKKCKGALIYGDICDVNRHRINFSELKSGYYLKRKDKRLWFTPDVMFRELRTSYKFLKNLGIQEDIRSQIFIERYTEYLSWCVTGYKEKVADPVCTTHYDFYPCQKFYHIFFVSILNGLKLWNKTFFFSVVNNKKITIQVNKALQKEYILFFKYIVGEKLHIKQRGISVRNDYEILKRENVLNIYESWVDALISKKMVSEYLLKKGYHHVAIYGMGRIGRHLYKEFRESKIHVDYIIDQKMSKLAKCYEDVPCFDIESERPYTELIIVTIVNESEQIINDLRKKTSESIRLINDIIFVL